MQNPYKVIIFLLYLYDQNNNVYVYRSFMVEQKSIGKYLFKDCQFEYARLDKVFLG